jgi:homoserine O-succinyltransferase
MVEIMDWTQRNVHRTIFICWGAQAALHHFHGARRYRMPQKAFGVYRHKVMNARSPYLRGFSDDLAVPVWMPSGSPVTGDGGRLATTNNFGASAQRFYRLRLVN